MIQIMRIYEDMIVYLIGIKKKSGYLDQSIFFGKICSGSDLSVGYNRKFSGILGHFGLMLSKWGFSKNRVIPVIPIIYGSLMSWKEESQIFSDQMIIKLRTR